MVYWIVWAVISLLFFAIYSAKVLPRLFRLAAGSAYPIADRWLENFNPAGGISVLYAPDALSSKYIKRYQIYRIKSNGYMPVFLGEWGQLPKSVEYEISAFDKRRLLLMKKRMCKNPTNARYTDAVTLPFETAFVSLSVRRADGEPILHPRKGTRRFPLFLALFALAAAFALTGVVFVILYTLFRILGAFPASGLLAPTPALWCICLLLPALVFMGVIMAAGCLLVYRETVAAWFAPLIRKLRVLFGRLSEKAAALRGRIALPVRSFLGKCRCAFFTVRSAVVQSRVFSALRRVAAFLTRPLRVRKGRRANNG